MTHFIQELLTRVDRLDESYQQMALDHQRETQFNREGQLRERKLQDELRKIKAFMVLPSATILTTQDFEVVFPRRQRERKRGTC